MDESARHRAALRQAKKIGLQVFASADAESEHELEPIPILFLTFGLHNCTQPRAAVQS
eukprot:COSAG02_NODE_2267_length_9282_cov_22.424044_3_plen_58_part_00